MLLEPLSQNLDVELLVSKAGNAMLLHRGAITHDYSWVQYDPITQEIQFITKDGALQNLGLEIHAQMYAPLKNTRELFMIEVNDDLTTQEPKLIKFSEVVG